MNVCSTCKFWRSFGTNCGRCDFVDFYETDDHMPVSPTMFMIRWQVDDSSNLCMELITGADFFCLHFEPAEEKKDTLKKEDATTCENSKWNLC